MVNADVTPPHRRVLSIQSHVTSGYVGNKAAVFPLQLLGYDVDVLNSCYLSNHTGYANGAPGKRLLGAELKEAMEGMRANGLLTEVTHLLTGYIGTPSCLEAIVETLKVLRAETNRNLVFVCDPVLGDNGKLYVSEAQIQIYIDMVLDLATILTPNCFELSLLTKIDICSEEDAFKACDYLHEKHGIKTIFVTGTCFEKLKKSVSVLVSSKIGSGPSRFAVDADYIDGHFTGSGDLMTALLLAWTDKLPENLVLACSNAMASVSAVLQSTVRLPKTKGLTPFPELRLVQSREVILEPPQELVTVRQL